MGKTGDTEAALTWEFKRYYLSPKYTTDIKEIPKVFELWGKCKKTLTK